MKKRKGRKKSLRSRKKGRGRGYGRHRRRPIKKPSMPKPPPRGDEKEETDS
jgi:hypothetical protein